MKHEYLPDMHEYKPKYYDIRIKSDTKIVSQKEQKCEWEACQQPGRCRAPKSPQDLENFYWFCTKHAQQYNKTWNFFQNMDETETLAYQKDILTGHRPTWKIGTGVHPATPLDFARHKIQKEAYKGFVHPSEEKEESSRAPARIPRLQKQAYETLELDPRDKKACNKRTISERYSKLVKLYHPDYNGGDRSLEENLKKVMEAYRILKEANRV